MQTPFTSQTNRYIYFPLDSLSSQSSLTEHNTFQFNPSPGENINILLEKERSVAVIKYGIG
jgi:hypothetical protein